MVDLVVDVMEMTGTEETNVCQIYKRQLLHFDASDIAFLTVIISKQEILIV